VKKNCRKVQPPE